MSNIQFPVKFWGRRCEFCGDEIQGDYVPHQCDWPRLGKSRHLLGSLAILGMIGVVKLGRPTVCR